MTTEPTHHDAPGRRTGLAALAAGVLFVLKEWAPFPFVSVLRTLSFALTALDGRSKVSWAFVAGAVVWTIAPFLAPERFRVFELAGLALAICWSLLPQNRTSRAPGAIAALLWGVTVFLVLRDRPVHSVMPWIGTALGLGFLLRFRAERFRRQVLAAMGGERATTTAPASPPTAPEPVQRIDLKVWQNPDGPPSLVHHGGTFHLVDLEAEPTGHDWKDQVVRTVLVFRVPLEGEKVLAGLAQATGVSVRAERTDPIALRLELTRSPWRDGATTLWLRRGCCARLVLRGERGHLTDFQPDARGFVVELVEQLHGRAVTAPAQRAWEAILAADEELRSRDLIEGTRGAITEREARMLCARSAGLGFWPLVELVQLTQDFPLAAREACARLVGEAHQRVLEPRSTGHASVAVALAALGRGSFDAFWGSIERTREEVAALRTLR